MPHTITTFVFRWSIVMWKKEKKPKPRWWKAYVYVDVEVNTREDYRTRCAERRNRSVVCTTLTMKNCVICFRVYRPTHRKAEHYDQVKVFFFVGRLLLVRFSLAGTFILLYLCNAFVVLVTGVDRMYDNNNTRYDRCHRTEWHADRRGQNTRYPWAYPSKRKYVALATYNNGEHTDDGRARATNGQGDGGLGRCT